MNLLQANGVPGEHAPSWYAATCHTQNYPVLQQHITTDACVIGAGYTGLSTALHLAAAGKSVALVDAHRVGWGASGRNGGQLGSGFNQDQYWLEKRFGEKKAHSLWQLCEAAKQSIHSLCSKHGIDADYRPGIISAMHRKRFVDAAHRYCEKLQTDYGYTQVEQLGRKQMQALVGSEAYYGGAVDHGAGHIHPLKLATGLAGAAHRSGARIFEHSQVLKIDSGSVKGSGNGDALVQTAQGSVTCEHVVLACNGYLDNLHAGVQRRVMPINNFIIATEPLGAMASELLPRRQSVFDSRFVVNYFRLSTDGRLLFGGGETYGYTFPGDIASLVRKPMLQVFPQLSNVNIDYAWGGTLAITLSRLPYVKALAPNMFAAGGYSGHGVALSVKAGDAIAQAILDDDRELALFAELPTGIFPGGDKFRSVLLAGAMSWYSLLDRF